MDTSQDPGATIKEELDAFDSSGNMDQPTSPTSGLDPGWEIKMELVHTDEEIQTDPLFAHEHSKDTGVTIKEELDASYSSACTSLQPQLRVSAMDVPTCSTSDVALAPSPDIFGTELPPAIVKIRAAYEEASKKELESVKPITFAQAQERERQALHLIEAVSLAAQMIASTDNPIIHQLQNAVAQTCNVQLARMLPEWRRQRIEARGLEDQLRAERAARRDAQEELRQMHCRLNEANAKLTIAQKTVGELEQQLTEARHHNSDKCQDQLETQTTEQPHQDLSYQKNLPTSKSCLRQRHNSSSDSSSSGSDTGGSSSSSSSSTGSRGRSTPRKKNSPDQLISQGENGQTPNLGTEESIAHSETTPATPPLGEDTEIQQEKSLQAPNMEIKGDTDQPETTALTQPSTRSGKKVCSVCRRAVGTILKFRCGACKQFWVRLNTKFLVGTLTTECLADHPPEIVIGCAHCRRLQYEKAFIRNYPRKPLPIPSLTGFQLDTASAVFRNMGGCRPVGPTTESRDRRGEEAGEEGAAEAMDGSSPLSITGPLHGSPV